MNAFYEQELKILQNLKKELDDSYRNIDLDINTNSLLLGLASLTSRIRQDMAETENEIARNFVESIVCELIRPLPARSLVEIIPAPTDNKEREIPNGASLISKSKNTYEKPFFWGITGKHKFNPAQKIISVKAKEDSEGFDCLEFERNGKGPWIIYINGDSEFAWGLWCSILEHTVGVAVKPYVIAKPENPWELCRDFFCFEEKFRYIYIENLPSKLRFGKKIPREIFSKICTDNFKLNILPIENSFKQNLDPVSLDKGMLEAKIRPNEKRQIILYLKEVLAGNIKKANFKEIEYRYNSEQLRFANLPPDSNVLSITACVCDGIAATKALEQGCTLQAKDSSMQTCDIRSAINALPFLPHAASGASEWEILGLLQRNYLNFFEGDALKKALEMQLWNAQGKQNYLAQSIKNVSLENKNAVYKGCLVPMACVKIVLSLDFFNINNYGFLGILHAYGEMLFYLFRKIFVCNLLVNLILRIEPFGVELKWE